MASILLYNQASKLHWMAPLFIECKKGRTLYGKLANPSLYDKFLTLTSMTSFSNLACTPRLLQGDDKWHKERASPNTYTILPKSTKPKSIILGPNTRLKLF